ncbi:MAG: peptidase S8, partial [Bacteroidetes bacterium]|nr:peptidase S8 [Fibrella sp.]
MQQRFGLVVALLLGSLCVVTGQPLPYTLQQRAQIEKTRQAIQQSRDNNYSRAVAVANQRGKFITDIHPDGSVFLLHRLTETGELLYLKTYSNARSATTTRTNSLYAGGSLGVDLSGTTAQVQDRLGIWDGGRVRGTHLELAGRVTQVDNPTGTDRHATHVAGTMVANGRNATVRGMSSQAKLRAWDFSNDEAEMSTASPDLLVS